MACRIGMTTNLEDRKKHWEGKCKNLRDWQILETHNSKKNAQAAEIRLAKQKGCDYHPGGSGPDYAIWYVYGFNFDAYY